MRPFQGRRTTFIALTVLLMAAVIYVVGESFSLRPHPAAAEEQDAVAVLLPKEGGMFRWAWRALEFVEAANVTGNRTLAQTYARRAYPGAPPTIPHAIEEPLGYGGKTCLACHENGGYVPKYTALAPIVPHPELTNCRQCHVPATTNSVFRPSNWVSVEPPLTGRRAMAGSPPVIPHSLPMRENCLACHGGPGAAREIRTTHPERIHCRQCHVPSVEELTWSRPVR
jgi:cytochrome c-type protein NapB